MGKRKHSKTEDEVKGVHTENVAGATLRKRRLAKRTNRGRVTAAAQTGTSPLGVLNDDCLLHVLSFIGGPEQLLQQRAVSRHWGSLASSDPLWRPHFLRMFGPHVFGATDEELARKGDKPVSRSYSYYAEEDEEHVNYARHAEDDEHPDWEYSDEDQVKVKVASKKKKQKKKKTKKESSKDARGGCGPVDDSSLQESIEHVRRALESKGSDGPGTVGGTWFYRYIAACRLMPRLRLPHLADALKSKFTDWCERTQEESCETSKLDVCMVDLPHYPRGDVHYRLHRLAVLLSLLSTNKHAPKPGEEMQIGYAGKSCTITLARFCYAFLHGKERELAEGLDLLSPPPACPDRKKMKAKGTKKKKKKKGKKALSESKDEDDENEHEYDEDGENARKAPRRYGWREFKEPALSLNVVGDFTPFAYFLSGPYGQKTRPFDISYPCLDEHEEIFGSSSDTQAAYCFRTPKRGWAPGFFNASFSWFNHAAISTFYNPTLRQILVAKAMEKEIVWTQSWDGIQPGATGSPRKCSTTERRGAESETAKLRQARRQHLLGRPSNIKSGLTHFTIMTKRSGMTSASCLTFALWATVLAFCFFSSAAAVDIDVLPLRIDNPKPDGSGVMFFHLLADPADSDIASLNGFKIASLSSSPSGQAFKLWNAAGNNCDGTVLSVGDPVPANGKVCFWADTTSTAEFESYLTYVAVDNSANEGTTPQKVVVVTYDVQQCPSIPDLGESGFATLPPSPIVAITLSGLEVKFEVTAAYVRNQTSWMVDFFNFDSSAGGHSADGTGRTCANHVAANYAGIDFEQWWVSQPRANFDDGLHASITDALDNALFPNYLSTPRWAVTNVGCGNVKFTATIPTVNLIATGASDCTAPGASGAAATASGLNYTATLYVNALRPKDVTNPAAGYYKTSFAYPFSFRLQQTVTDLSSTSSSWAFAVAVDDLVVTRGTSLTLKLETSIRAPLVNSPDITTASFRMASGFPYQSERTTAGKSPVLTRVSDNSHCGTSETVACVIVWQMVLPELTQAEAGGSMQQYNQQYIGAYSFLWTTEDGDELASNLIIDAVAANTTDLGQLSVQSAIRFFRTEATMLVPASTGLATPTFSTGEQVWVRHDFLVDNSDVSAYRFTLQRAWVCWSPVSDFVPSVASSGTGCSTDIAGVMEERLGQRVLLYNVTNTVNSGIIPDVTFPVGSTQKARIWGFDLVLPTDAGWTDGESVHNGFGINALPLVFNSQINNYYFHLVSEVSQSPSKRGASGKTREVHTVFAPGNRKRATVEDGSSGTGLSKITVYSDSPSSASALGSWLDIFH